MEVLMATKTASKKAEEFVYFFGGGKADGHGKMKDLLGGKGAGLAEMTNAGVPVPPGFTITTDVCALFYTNNNNVPKAADDQMVAAMMNIEKLQGKKFGDKNDPLLVSVRSGAKFSMPGMMDTVLNLGLNDESVQGLASKTGNEWFAYDAYRRFIQMFGKVVLDIDSELFEHEIKKQKKKRKVKTDVNLTSEDWKELCETYKGIIKKQTGKPFPQDPWTQLRMSRDAVFGSWNNPRAVTYRKLNDISADLGTAVNVQTMVFGNMGDTSATGVGFTRNPATGEKEFYGEYMINAQGEDVVAGIRTPSPINEMDKDLPKAYKELRKITAMLEKHYKDVQDFEFTVQEGKLYMLQTRDGKRTGPAAVKIAVDMVREKLITQAQAVVRVEPSSLDQLLHPIFDPKERLKAKAAAKGLPASPGAATGVVVFSADDAVEWANKKNKKVILVRHETSPDDIHGMHVAEGIVTSTGGMTSHAAVVGRQMGTPCIAGVGDVRINYNAKTFTVDGNTVKEGDMISIDGSTGELFLSAIPTMSSEIVQVVSGRMKAAQSQKFKDFSDLLSWADKFRTLGIRTNADTPGDSAMAIAMGAEGIGLCRTEHMFFASDRIKIMQQMILAVDEKSRRVALQKLLPMQKKDFIGIFKAMSGKPVTIRLLDPPLHEFLPKREDLMVEIAQLEIQKPDSTKIKKLSKVLARINDLHEFNPMLGMRGCRLGLTMPEISEMQITAIMEAAVECIRKKIKAQPEIMIPLTGMKSEMKAAYEQVDRICKEIIKKSKVKVPYSIGTMIEVPRAAATADEMAEYAQFFSFGTNDLTQMTFGYSRDDAGRFISHYLETGILDKDPFQTLDQVGVGRLIQSAVKLGRETRKDLKVGICGEHGGDPASIDFCHNNGFNYVSCSPFRVPIARLAAARAALLKDAGFIDK
jgi:pyruvate,orthophosphate dikinase